MAIDDWYRGDPIILGGRGSCPDCRNGHHSECLGDAWDGDVPTICACFKENHGHRRRPPKTVADDEADRTQQRDLKGQGW